MNNQEQILMTLIQGQEGRAWALDKNGWKNNHEAFVCRWDYVECDSYQTTVIGIHMIEADFVGSLPSELGNLLTLQEISFRRNLLVGSIPQEIANLPHLEKLLLSENRLTGTIPAFASYKLKTMDLNYNLLSGSLAPKLFVNNNQLTEVDLASNKLTGILPTFLPESKYYKLMTLSLSDNQFTGTIHPYLGTSDTLTYLYLDGNNLMGTIPLDFTGESSSELQELWLQNNQLTGTIPPSIGEMHTLFNFYVDGNKLTGEVPSSLCRSEINADFFQDIDTSSNGEDRDYCDSIACPPGTVSLEGVYPCRPCNELYFNPYLGRVNKCIDLVEFDILKVFYEATGGKQWINMEKPWDLQDSTYCNLEGIECGNHGNIISIKLDKRGLRGTIPEEMGYLKYLEELDLSDNYLKGILPSDLRWGPLRFLDVSRNQIKGIIPHTLCRKEGINGNGRNGVFDCDLIQCPAGTRSRLGRATQDVSCRPCRRGTDTPFIGSTKCSVLFHIPHHLRAYTQEHNPIIPIVITLLLITGIYVSCFAAFDRTLIRLESSDEEALDERILSRKKDGDEEDESDDDEENTKTRKPYKDVPEEDNLMSFDDTDRRKGKGQEDNQDNLSLPRRKGRAYNEKKIISLEDHDIDEEAIKRKKKSLINFEEESEIVDRQDPNLDEDEDEDEDEDDEDIGDDESTVDGHNEKVSYKKLADGSVTLV